jgi:hypothetical protein
LKKISNRTLAIVLWKSWKIVMIAWMIAASSGCDPGATESCSDDDHADAGDVMSPDGGVPSPDGSVPSPDAQAPSPDASVPTPDSGVPSPDASVPSPDAGAPAPDAGAPDPDASVPSPDAAPAVPSMSYALAPDDAESAQGIVVGGSISAVLAKYRFTAVGEERTLRKIRVSVHPHAVPGIRNLRLYDGSTLLSVPVVPDAAGNADFMQGLAFIVPADSSKTLTVKAELAAVGPADAPSGLDLTATLRDGIGGSEAGTFEVIDASGNVETAGISGDVMGRIKILRKTKPTVSLAYLQGGYLANGQQTLSRFVITADAAGDLSVRTISFGTVLSDQGGAPLTVASPAIREYGSGTALPASVTTYGDAFSVTFATELTVPAGTSRTFEMLATVTGADVSLETVMTTVLGSEPPGDGFLWSDISAVPHTVVSADWMNGDLERTLPTAAQMRYRD